MVGSIVVICLVSVAALLKTRSAVLDGTFRNVLAFGVLGLVGFVMAALAARLVHGREPRRTGMVGHPLGPDHGQALPLGEVRRDSFP